MKVVGMLASTPNGLGSLDESKSNVNIEQKNVYIMKKAKDARALYTFTNLNPSEIANLSLNELFLSSRAII
jgi:hypothetical protein